MLGHRDIKTTMIYAHLTQDHIKAQMEKLNEVPIPEICPKSAQNPKEKKKGESTVNRFPLRIAMVPKGGLEPPRVSPPPPQDGVSTKFHYVGGIAHREYFSKNYVDIVTLPRDPSGPVGRNRDKFPPFMCR